MYRAYVANLQSLLMDTVEQQGAAIERAAEMIADVMGAGGVIHVFGSGHSHMMAEEVFHRAGGLMAVNAMLDPNLTSFGMLRVAQVERTEGYAAALFNSYDIRSGELLVVVSTSGINPLPIELAVQARAACAQVIAITSAAAYAQVPSRHSSGQKLVDVTSHVIDSGVPLGDALLDFDEPGIRIGPTSTVIGAALMNAVMVEAANVLKQRGQEVPVLVSRNIPGGDERNKDLERRYGSRLQALRN